MSYCVNCGVELDQEAKNCPLCKTPVINPRLFNRKIEQEGEQNAFPSEKGQVETVVRKDLGILLSVLVLSTSIICGILNWLVFNGTLWSLAVIGVCVILWVMMIPAVIYTRQPVYVSVLYDALAVALYLYMLTYLSGSREWFWGLGMPIVVLILAVAEVFVFCVRKLPRAFLTVSLYVFSGIGIICVGLDMLIRRYLTGELGIRWSAVVLTVCAILDIVIITLLSRRKLRNEVRRRLHF